MDKKQIEKIIRKAYDTPPAFQAACELYCKGVTEQDIVNMKDIIPDPWRIEIAMVMRDIQQVVMSKM